MKQILMKVEDWLFPEQSEVVKVETETEQEHISNRKFIFMVAMGIAIIVTMEVLFH